MVAPALVLGILGLMNADKKGNDEGTVSIKASSDSSMCIRTEEFNDDKAYLMLMDCSPGHGHEPEDNRFHLRMIKDQYRQVRIADEEFEIEGNGCFSWNGISDTKIMTDKCNLDNSAQHWSFKKISDDKFQWTHKNTGKCVRTPGMTNGTTLQMANCDTNDKNQIWESEFSNQDSKWEEAGEITLRPAIDKSLCMTTDPLVTQSSIMNLVPCNKSNKKEDGGNKIFDLGKVAGDYLQIETIIDSDEGEFACMFTGMTNNSPILTQDCNHNDEMQYWKFIRTSTKSDDELRVNVQMLHKESGKCMRATRDMTTVMSADCDKSDMHQIWIMERMI